MGAPYWKPDARGQISGLTRGSTRAHIARAALEGMALQNAELLLAMRGDLKGPLKSLKVDGGAAVNDLLMRLQADFLGIPCVRPKVTETTSVGAAFMAGLGIGLWKDLGAVRRVWVKEAEFRPRLSSGERRQRLDRWRQAARTA